MLRTTIGGPPRDTRAMAESARHRPVSYPVVFALGGEDPAAGSLTVDEGGITLEGRRHGEPVKLGITRVELDRVRIGRSPQEALDGYPTVVLERRAGPRVRVSPFGAGLLHELADLLASLVERPGETADHVAVIVPLREGSQQRVRELIERGPPFDAAMLGLRHHRILLAPTEAVLVFEGPHLRRSLEHALAEPSLWRAGLDWRTCMAGRPHVSEQETVTEEHEVVYDWTTRAATAERS